MKILTKFSLLTFLALFIVNNSFGQKQTFDISITVSSSSKTATETFESYLTRELRSLNDVSIVKSDGLYDIKVLILKDQSVSGRDLGYTMAAVVNWRTLCYSTTANKNYPCYVYDNLYLYSGGKDDIRKMVEDFVVAFDTDQLKPLR